MIHFTLQEAQLAFAALNSTSYPEPNRNTMRFFPITEQKDAAELAKAMKEGLVTDEDKVKEGDVELDTAGKALLIKCLNREWSAFDAIIKIALEEKLK